MTTRMSSKWSLVCGLCGEPCSNADELFCPSCDGPAIIRYQQPPGGMSASNEAGVWRFRRWLPLDNGDRAITLGEGSTPLVRLERWPHSLGLEQVYAKLEYAGPTGSFKDRGAAVLISHAVARGARHVVEDSSGNAGAAIAAYAARAGLECTIFAPAGAPPAKLVQIRAYGGEVIPVEGSREDVAAAAVAAAAESPSSTYYAGHNSNPYFVEGTKTAAFELAEEFPGGLPDDVILPVGGGSLFCGLALGIAQWRAEGLRQASPRIHLVQARGCMPLVAAFEAGESQPLAVDRYPTVAGGIEIASPQRGALILRLLRESGGSAIAVGDDEILAAHRALARLDGIYMEPTSAAAFAGLSHLVDRGVISRNDRVAVLVTGSGLKNPPALPEVRT
jgi:threonine synthase